MQNPVEPTAAENERLLTDGRHLRSAASRQRIMDAMLALVQEGNPDPRAEDVAARAGVGLRTVFRLFRDMETVVAEMLAAQRQEYIDCFLAKFEVPPGPERMRELFGRLADLYERRMPVRRAAVIRRYTSPSLAAGMRELDAAVAGFIHAQQLGLSEHQQIMLNLLVSYDTWMRLRDSQGLDYDQALATLRQAMAQILPTA